MKALRTPVAVLLLAAAGCGGGPEKVTVPPPAAPTKEALYAEGHRLYQTQQLDSAESRLLGALRLDSTYADPLADLAGVYYDRAMRSPEGSAVRREDLRRSSAALVRLERAGRDDAELYERLCEISVALGDERAFLRWAKKNAERYPFERQYYNLGLAYYGVEDWQGCIRTQKEAIQKFPDSPYIGSYHRQLGRAYMKVDRDQTAERTFTAGLAAADRKLAALKKAPGGSSPADARRLTDDKVAMLQSLRKLHQVYGAQDKLRGVEEQLKALGYTP